MTLPKKYGMGMLLGIAVGVLTAVGQKYLPAELNFLANSGAIWLVPAYLTSYYGKLGKGNSVGMCVVCLLCCVYGFYGFQALRSRHFLTVGFYTAVWTVCALAGGTVFGLGAYLANEGRGFWKCCGLNLLPSVFLAESLNRTLHIREYSHMIPAVILTAAMGLALYVCVNGKRALAKWNLLSLGMITALGLAGYEVLFRITV